MATVPGLQSILGLPFPVRGLPFGVVFPILDADGDPVPGAAGLDSEISKDGDTFADCTNEAVEIATSSGMYYLLLTTSEMTAQAVSLIIKTSTSGAKTTPIVLYPRAPIQMRSATAQAGAAGTLTLDSSAVAVDDYYNNMVLYLDGGTGSGQVRMITDYVGSTKVASVTPNWTTTPDSTTTFKVYLVEAQQLATLAGVTHTGAVIPTVTTTTTATNVTTVNGLAAGVITAASIATNAIDADAIAADAVTEIQSGLATAAALTTVDDFLDTEIAAILAAVDTEVAAIKAKTDSLTFTGTDVHATLDGETVTPAAGSITASVIATNAIDADALATDAATELANAMAARVYEGSMTLEHIVRIFLAALANKSGGSGTSTITFRDLADTKNRIAATVSSGNRTAVTLDGS